MKNKLKKISSLFCITILFLFLFDYIGSYGYDFKYILVVDVVQKIKDRFENLDTYQADFKIISEKAGSKIRQSGRISYKKRSKMLIEFREPYGQKIVSDGRAMWLYIPSMNVVAQQDLKNETGSLFTAGTSNGLKRLFAKYHYTFASKNQPESQQDGTKAYTLSLMQKESRSGFRKLKLWISSEFMIKKVSGETTSGKELEIIFENIKTDVDLSNGMFKFDIPSRVKVVTNPFVSEE